MAVRKWGSEQLVNTNTPNVQSGSRIAALPSGGFVVIWTDNDSAGGDGDSSSIKMQRFDAAGVKLGSETLVNTTTPGGQTDGEVAVLDDGSFVVAWRDFTTNDIRFRRFEADGTAIDATDRLGVGGASGCSSPRSWRQRAAALRWPITISAAPRATTG